MRFAGGKVAREAEGLSPPEAARAAIFACAGAGSRGRDNGRSRGRVDSIADAASCMSWLGFQGREPSVNLKTNCAASYTGMEPVDEASDSWELCEIFCGCWGPPLSAAVARLASARSSLELLVRFAASAPDGPPGPVGEEKLISLPNMDHLFLAAGSEFKPSGSELLLSFVTGEGGLAS